MKSSDVIKRISKFAGINETEEQLFFDAFTKKLFEKFFRSEDYRTRESNGTGLGLYVTQKLARKLEAEISVESKLNEGSTFTILIGSLPEPKPRHHRAGA